MKRTLLALAAVTGLAVTVPATSASAAAASVATMSAAAPDTCVQGYVWRGARPTDHVCVTPAVRDQTARDNQVKASRWVSGAFGAHTCVQGYVWRQAFSGDDVCVTPTVRQQVRADNAAAAGRVAKGASNGAASASTASKSFTWKGSDAGRCSMFIGAKWTLYPNGTAQFDGTVRSKSGDDAWLMWAHLKDANGAILADIQVAGSTSTKFVKNLPVSWQQYRWLAKGQFDPSLYPLIKRMSLSNHC